MQYYNLCPTSSALFLFSDTKDLSFGHTLNASALYKIIYNDGATVQLKVNDSRCVLKTGQVLFCKPLDTFEIVSQHQNLKVLAFNSDFYQLSSTEEKRNFYNFWFFGVQNPYKMILTDEQQPLYTQLFDIIQEEIQELNVVLETLRDALKYIIGSASLRFQIKLIKPLQKGSPSLNFKKFNHLVEAYLNGKTSFETVCKSINLNASTLLDFISNYSEEKHHYCLHQSTDNTTKLEELGDIKADLPKMKGHKNLFSNSPTQSESILSITRSA